MEERIALMRAYDSGGFSVSELCAQFEISRETFYVWKRRREAGDTHWFEEHSRAPVLCPHALAPEVVAQIVALRRRFPSFGPKKIQARLRRETPQIVWPAASTIGQVVQRAGLVEARPRRRRARPQGEVAVVAEEPNIEWGGDFKGWFRTLDGTRCDPLTLTDTATRYLISIRITPPTHAGVQAALDRIFAEIGLPEAIRTDNGVPFGSIGAGGLSRLSVWLLKLGIEPRFTRPGKPQDNGRHERMHRTLKAQTTRPAACSLQEQQARFDAFRHHYNEERPHEALGQTEPARCWRPPQRQLPSRIEEPWYDADYEVRRVRPTGEIKWRGELVFIGEALAGEPVGLLEQEHGGHLVRFCQRDLGLLDAANRFHRFAPPRSRLRCAVEAVTMPK